MNTENLIIRIDAMLADEAELDPEPDGAAAGPDSELAPASTTDSFTWTDAWAWTTEPVDPDSYDFDTPDHECNAEHCAYGPDATPWDTPVPVWFHGETRDGRALTWQRHDVVIPPEFSVAGDASALLQKGEWRGDPELLAAIEPAAVPYRYPDVFHTVAAIMLRVLGPESSVIDSNGATWGPIDADVLDAERIVR